MAPLVVKPENAIRRAEDLINVGQDVAALQSLHEMLTSKRYRTFTDAHEMMTMKLLELCVNLRKGKIAKEALVAFRNLTQNGYVSSLENVVKKYLELAEVKVAGAQAKADKLILEQIEDLEALETPESIMLSSVSSQDNKDRHDRELVAPWLKQLWEAYRTILDVLRNNNKLEALYQNVANAAFEFCLKYSRKMELRRLCDLLRNHLLSLAKYSHQAHAVNLSSPESLQMHLQTRFVQLKASAQLEQWQEAFRSIEDINGLTMLARKPLHPAMWVDFYEKLTRIFFVSRDYLFHAASFNKYYFAYTRLPKTSEKVTTSLASMVLLSALSAPLSVGSSTLSLGQDESQVRQTRLTHLLHMRSTPTRETLISDALEDSLLSLVHPEVKAIYEILEVNFHPLTATKTIEPYLMQLEKNTEAQRYVKPLYRVLLTRLLKELCKLYSTIRMETVLKLTAFPAPYTMSPFELERFIVQGCKRGEFAFRINHLNKTLTVDPTLLGFEGPGGAQSPAAALRMHLSTMASHLAETVELIDPSVAQERKEKKQQVLKKILSGLEEERTQILARKEMIERKKEMAETLLAQKERAEAQERARLAQEQAEAEKQRLDAESQRREVERLRREREEIEHQQALQLAEEMKKKNIDIAVEDVEKMDKDRLLQLQVEHLEKEKRELQERLKILSKRIDHTERAYREEEIPLIASSYEKQKKEDEEHHEQAYQRILEATKRQHKMDVEAKGRLARIKPEVDAYRAKIMEAHNAKYESKKAESAAMIAEAKKKRIAELKAKHEADLQKERAEAEAAAKKEEEERLRQEEKEKADAARREELLKEKEEREKQMAEAQEKAQRQLEREKEAEENRRRREEARSSAPASRQDSEQDLDWTQVRRSRDSFASGGSQPDKPEPWRPRRREGEGARPPAGPTSSASRDDRSTGDWRRPAATPSVRSSATSSPAPDRKPSAYVPPAMRNKEKKEGSSEGPWRRQ